MFNKLSIKIFSISILFVLFFSFSFKNSVAKNYGDGKYGGNFYGPDDLTDSSPPACQETKPGDEAPVLYAASPQDSSRIKIFFSKAGDPFDHYVIEYGTKPTNYSYSVDKVDKNATSYEIKLLSPDTIYYFRVRAGNGCAVGDWSNELSARTNKTSRSVSKVINIKKDTSVDENQTDVESYIVKLRFLDTKGKPVKGLKVILHSEPIQATTDENGYVTFEKIGKGEHKIAIEDPKFTGEQTLYVSGNSDKMNLTITLKMNENYISPKAWTIMTVLALISIALIINSIRILRRQNNHHRIK